MTGDSGTIAGELYNALSAKGIAVRQTNYYPDGGWRLQVASRGGLIRGVPVIQFNPATHTIQLRIDRLISSKSIASFEWDPQVDEGRLVAEICVMVADQVGTSGKSR